MSSNNETLVYLNFVQIKQLAKMVKYLNVFERLKSIGS